MVPQLRKSQAQSILDESEILHIATGATSVRLTEKGMEYFFRTSPRDDEQGRVAAQYIKNLGYGKIAIVHDNSSYSKGLAEETRAVLEEEGVQVVFFDALTPKERDYSPILTRLRAAEPDLFFYPGSAEAGLGSEKGNGLECAHDGRRLRGQRRPRADCRAFLL